MYELELKAGLIDLLTEMRDACLEPGADAEAIRVKAISGLRELRQQAAEIEDRRKVGGE